MDGGRARPREVGLWEGKINIPCVYLSRNLFIHHCIESGRDWDMESDVRLLRAEQSGIQWKENED